MVLTPQMAISHLVMTIGVGISQKKNIKKFDLVTIILWFDPYIFFCCHHFWQYKNLQIFRRCRDFSISPAPRDKLGFEVNWDLVGAGLGTWARQLTIKELYDPDFAVCNQIILWI